MQVQLQVRKVFGNDLDRGCCFGKQHAVRLRELTSDSVTLAFHHQMAPVVHASERLLHHYPVEWSKHIDKELQNGRQLSWAQMDHMVTVDRRNQTIRHSFQLSAFLESTCKQQGVQQWQGNNRDRCPRMAL
jgi:hypothetical protein